MGSEMDARSRLFVLPNTGPFALRPEAVRASSRSGWRPTEDLGAEPLRPDQGRVKSAQERVKSAPERVTSAQEPAKGAPRRRRGIRTRRRSDKGKGYQLTSTGERARCRRRRAGPARGRAPRGEGSLHE